MRTRRGQATVEYVLLISVLIIAMVASAYVFVPSFETGVSSLADDVAAMLSGEGNEAVEGRDGGDECPFTFDPRTGRYHDEENDYLMVSFADAADAGC